MSDNFLIYKTEDEHIEINVVFDAENETVWLSQNQMAELFTTTKQNISSHISDIYKEGELEEKATVKDFLTVRKEGSREVSRYIKGYNLDVIISVGYRVKSIRGTQFRQWATKRLNEYIRKGFTMDDERLKELGGGTYFEELKERYRDIRTSEKVFYRQVLDMYATSIDYDPRAEISIEFFKKVQNKIHYAVHGETAAEVIYNRADAEKKYMGLRTFRGDRPHLRDTEIAKNYLDESELRAMGQIVEGYLAFAERQADREVYMTMQDWAEHLNGILTSTGEQLLQGAGTITHAQAIEKAHDEYRKYQERTLSNVEKDFLETIKELEGRVDE